MDMYQCLSWSVKRVAEATYYKNGTKEFNIWGNSVPAVWQQPSRPWYCDSLLYDVSNELLQKLQVIQNAAARVMMGARKFHHITLVLRELRWLPIHQCIKLKLVMTIYKCLHGLAPPYLEDDCVPLVLSMASKQKLVIRLTQTVHGARDIAVSYAARKD